ncbi:STAS domain-containing protein [Streptomyces sp. NPDC096030]|uniref:STAS domain-containing protein n=1 Tax=Streptomyces sp. NPDC096030 TaxID=3155423 RepID=UPI003327EAF3
MRLQVHTEPEQGPVRVIRCEGELDMESAPALERAGQRAALQGGVERLVLDVTGVTFADSSGLNCLIQLHQIVPIVLSGPLPSQLLRLLQVTGADAIFPRAGNVDAARAM